MEHKQVMMLACSALRREITLIMEEENLHYPVFYLPDELHLTPEKLNAYLCDFIPRLTGVDYLLLPMGRCGNGTAGIPSGEATIVLPKCEDCISLLLSRENLASVERPKYSYFFTDSWLDTSTSFLREFEHSLDKYGQSRGERVIRAMYKNYKYFTYIDTGCGNFETAAARVQPFTKLIDVEIVTLAAHFGVLRKMLTLNFNESDPDFLLVPPGQKASFDPVLAAR